MSYKISSVKKISLLAAAVLAILLLRAPHKTYAHFPATDNTMTVVLHVDPDDDPVPGQPAKLNFIFDDSSNRFQIAKCSCNLSISEQGEELFLAPLRPLSSGQLSVYGAALPYTFPNRDVYQITLTGQPISPGTFQPFHVIWNLRVDQDTPTAQSFSATTFLSFFVAVLSLMAVIGTIIYKLA